jgi:hypothetical protein
VGVVRESDPTQSEQEHEMATITCGKCQTTHQSIDAVRACHDGATIATCGWLVERYQGWVDEETGEGESWLVTVDCGAECIYDERGYRCAAGHEHVNMETRHREQWDYAEDAGEAMNLMRAGVQPFTMDGHIATSPADFAWAGR